MTIRFWRCKNTALFHWGYSEIIHKCRCDFALHQLHPHLVIHNLLLLERLCTLDWRCSSKYWHQIMWQFSTRINLRTSTFRTFFTPVCQMNLIDLIMLNVEYWIFVFVFFCRQAQWKKSKQIYKIRHGQIDAIPRAKFFSPSIIFLTFFSQLFDS